MTNTIGDEGTNFEESAATMTVPGKEMKDGEGTIGMTGEMILNFNAVPASSFPAFPLRGFIPFHLTCVAFSLTKFC